MHVRFGAALGLVASAAMTVLAAAGASGRGPDREARLASLREQIERLEREQKEITARERGVLADLERSRSDLALCRVRLEETDLRLAQIRDAVSSREQTIDRLDGAQDERRSYLAMRVRQLYLEGPSRAARIALGSEDIEDYLAGLRYAAWLGARDRDTLRAYRLDQTRIDDERAALVGEQARLVAVREELATARSALDGAVRRQEDLLRRLDRDRSLRRSAVEELRTASTALGALVDAREVPGEEVLPDLARFRGLLDPPVDGQVATGFGDVVHPRFKTRVPHPGIDYTAEEGTPFRAVFEGRVLFAGWLRGYGLTAIVDHGHDAVSVYSHASALVVEEGEAVLRGQRLGYVGQTGSTTGGSHLYFELRRAGTPVDPAPWFR